MLENEFLEPTFIYIFAQSTDFFDICKQFSKILVLIEKEI